MTWIFGSFLVTPCALTTCHAVMSKQRYDSSAIRALEYNRCETGRRPRDENHVVRLSQCAENRSRARDTKSIRGVSDELAKGCKRCPPPDSQKKIGEEEVLSLSICLSLYLSTNIKLEALFENKMRDIFL